MPGSAEARYDVVRPSDISCRINSSTPHQGCRPGNECRDDSGVCGGVVMQNTQQPCHSPIVTLGLDPRVQRRVTERLPWMLGSSPSMTIGYVAKGVRTEEHHHGCPALRDRPRKVAQSPLDIRRLSLRERVCHHL